MNALSLSTVAMLIGALVIAGALACLLANQTVQRMLDAFPRSTPAAWAITALDLLWVAWIIHHASLGRFESWKPALFILAPLSFYMLITFMDELLAPRALGGLLLLVANPVLKIAQWHDSDWRLVVIALAYVWVVAGMALVLSPYLFRRVVHFVAKRPGLLRLSVVFRLALGAALIALALTVY